MPSLIPYIMAPALIGLLVGAVLLITAPDNSLRASIGEAIFYICTTVIALVLAMLFLCGLFARI